MRDKDERARESKFDSLEAYQRSLDERCQPADLRAAKERLGTFLAAEYGRFALIVEVKAPRGVQITLCRFNRDGSNDGRDMLAFAFCYTEAAAILAALEKVGG